MEVIGFDLRQKPKEEDPVFMESPAAEISKDHIKFLDKYKDAVDEFDALLRKHRGPVLGAPLEIRSATPVQTTAEVDPSTDRNYVTDAELLVLQATSGSNTGDNAVNSLYSGLVTMTYPGAGIALSTGTAWGTSITNNSANWNTAFAWGDHSLEGYLTGETDPVFLASDAAAVTAAAITNWNTAYGWGNHGTVGYLTAETDPVFLASSAASISAGNITNWNTAYSWGNHASGGYVTIASLGTGVATFLATPSSANLLAAVTDETGTGALVFANTPTLVTPVLGVATATTINKVTFTAPASGSTLTILNGKTLTVNKTITLEGTDSTTMTFPSTSATIARTDAANTFTGHQTIEGVTSTGATGTGKFVFDNSPTLITPVLGVATATSINGTTIPSSKTLVVTTDKISVLAATSSSELAGVISDETGSGALVFGTAPTFTTNITTPLVIGGTGTTSTLTLKTTSGVGTTNADMIFQVGNNGATEAMRILNSGNVGVGTTTPAARFTVSTTGDTTAYDATATDAQVAAKATIQIYNTATFTNSFSQLIFNPRPDSVARIVAGDNGSNYSDLRFITEATTPAERMRIGSTGNIFFNTTTLPSGATFNLVLGGGATSPVLGAATADIVSVAAVDKAAGDRRLYIQSESGTAISLGNDRLNFGAATGLISIAGTDIFSATTTAANLLGYLRVGSLSAPNSTTAGDLTAQRVNIGNTTVNVTQLNVYKSAGNSIVTIDNTGNGNTSGIDFSRERTSGTGVIGGAMFMKSDTSTNNAFLYIQSQSASAASGTTSALSAGNGVRLILKGGTGVFSVETGASETFKIDASGNSLNTGYLRVGSVSAPSNTTAGDLTATRLNLGNGAAFSAGGRFILTSGTMTGTSGTEEYARIYSTISPSGASTANYYTLNARNQFNTAQTTSGTPHAAGFFSNEAINSGALVEMNGARYIGLLTSTSTATMGNVTTITGLSARSLNAANGSNASLGSTVTSIIGIKVDTPFNTGTNPLTITGNAGIVVDSIGTVGTNNTYLLLGTATIPTGNWGIYNASTYDNYINGNVGIGTTTFGTSATKTLALFNGTVPSTSPADMVQLFSVDLSAGNATLGLRTETAVVTEAVTSDRTLSVVINGTTYRILLKA